MVSFVCYLFIWSCGCLQGGEPSLGEHLIADLFSHAIEIRTHIDGLEKKIKAVCKKVVNLKKKLSRAPEAFKEMDKEIKCL